MSSDYSNVEQFLRKLNEKIKNEGYIHDQIYNCDETGLMWKELPNKTLASINQTKAECYKAFKAKVSLLFGINAAGTHRLKPLLIGKYQNPRPLRGNKEKL